MSPVNSSGKYQRDSSRDTVVRGIVVGGEWNLLLTYNSIGNMIDSKYCRQLFICSVIFKEETVS
jgi:hypothetical protein